MPKPSTRQPAAKPGRKPGGRKKQSDNGQDVMYPFFYSVAHVDEEYRDPERSVDGYGDPITMEQMKELLGWEEEKTKGAFGSNFLLKDENGVKIRCLRNMNNRELDERRCRTLAHVLLKRQWEPNGEAMSIGRYGNVLSGQHRGIGLILAEQMRTGPQAPTWEKYWQGPVCLQTVISYGVREDSKVTRTLDNVKPRTLSDVMFTDPNLFPTNSVEERRELVRIGALCMREFWYRCDFANLCFTNQYRTHTESLEVFDRYPSLFKAIKHIWTESKSRKMERNTFITAAGASAMMYLMAACHTDQDEFRNHVKEGRDSEDLIDLSAWSKAEEYWALILKNSTQTAPIRKAIARTFDTENGGSGGTTAERYGILIKGWAAFLNKGKITPGDLHLDYFQEPETDEEGGSRWHMIETISCDGIDVNGIKEPDRDELIRLKDSNWNNGETPADPGEPEETDDNGPQDEYEAPLGRGDWRGRMERAGIIKPKEQK